MALLADHFAVEEVVTADPGPRYNVAPTDSLVAVAVSSEIRRIGTFRWGLVPPWADDPAVGSRMINARAETLLTSRVFRPSFERRRCLIPATGFYEWSAVAGHREKQAWHLRPAGGAGGGVLAFAGLWSSWRPRGAPRDDDSVRLVTCTIVTTAANRLVAPVHDRMPVVLPASAWDEWLDPANDDVDDLA